MQVQMRWRWEAWSCYVCRMPTRELPNAGLGRHGLFCLVSRSGIKEATNYNQPQPTTTNHNQLQPTTTNYNQPQPTTTNHNQLQPTTTNYNQPQPTTTNQLQTTTINYDNGAT